MDPSERIVTKSPKVGPALIFSISLVNTKEDIIDGTLKSENIAEEWGGGGGRTPCWGIGGQLRGREDGCERTVGLTPALREWCGGEDSEDNGSTVESCGQ
jgi:hypothetical protein